MSIVDIISHALIEHETRAAREGRALEANFAALIREIVMSTLTDLEGRIGEQGGRLTQLETDVKALASKAGGILISQDTLDTLTAQVSTNNDRIAALDATVTAPPPATPAPAPATPAPAPATGL